MKKKNHINYETSCTNESQKEKCFIYIIYSYILNIFLQIQCLDSKFLKWLYCLYIFFVIISNIYFFLMSLPRILIYLSFYPFIFWIFLFTVISFAWTIFFIFDLFRFELVPQSALTIAPLSHSHQRDTIPTAKMKCDFDLITEKYVHKP